MYLFKYFNLTQNNTFTSKILIDTELKDAFMLFDYNKTDKIALRDIGPVIRSVGLKPSEAEVQEIMQEVTEAGGGCSLFISF